MMVFTQPWFPLVLAYSLVMIVALLALQFMSLQRFADKPGEVVMIILMSTGMLLLAWVPFPWVIKIFPAICLAALGARLTRSPERSGYLMGQCWACLILYFIGVSGAVLN